MREIKFRAWDTAKKEWIAKDFHIMGEVMMGGQLFDRRVEQFNDVDIQQYTGLNDKNGKEIYEGDIICYKDNEMGSIKQYEYQWVFNRGKHIEFFEDYTGAPWYSDCWKVIGNIYENPELVK